MQEFIGSVRQSVQDFPGLYIAVLAAAVLCLFLWIMAMRASRRKRGEKEALIAVLEHEKALRTQFKTITQQQLIDTPAERLVEGVCCNIQMQLEQQPEMQAAYDALEPPCRLIYALGYVVQDSRAALSEFFRKNGVPLTDDALRAVHQLVGGEFAQLFRREFDAFDERNEKASLIKENIEQDDKRFRELAQEFGDSRYAQAKEFIIANSTYFVH